MRDLLYKSRCLFVLLVLGQLASMAQAEPQPSVIFIVNAIGEAGDVEVQVGDNPKVPLTRQRALGPIGLAEGDYSVKVWISGAEKLEAKVTLAGEEKAIVIVGATKVGEGESLEWNTFLRKLPFLELNAAGEGEQTKPVKGDKAGRRVRILNASSEPLKIKLSAGDVLDLEPNGTEIVETKKSSIQLEINDVSVATVDFRDVRTWTAVVYRDEAGSAVSVLVPELR